MTTRITGSHIGNKKVEMCHESSGSKIVTSAPLDNNGDGSLFSPTDLVAASLGSCMVTIMAIIAERSKINLPSIRFEVEKHMSTNPRRIAALPIKFYLPASLTQEERSKLENGALTCPVKASLRSDVEVTATFEYE